MAGRADLRLMPLARRVMAVQKGEGSVMLVDKWVGERRAWAREREAGVSVDIVHQRRHRPARVAAVATERAGQLDDPHKGWLRVRAHAHVTSIWYMRHNQQHDRKHPRQ